MLANNYLNFLHRNDIINIIDSYEDTTYDEINYGHGIGCQDCPYDHYESLNEKEKVDVMKPKYVHALIYHNETIKYIRILKSVNFYLYDDLNYSETDTIDSLCLKYIKKRNIYYVNFQPIELYKGRNLNEIIEVYFISENKHIKIFEKLYEAGLLQWTKTQDDSDNCKTYNVLGNKILDLRYINLSKK